MSKMDLVLAEENGVGRDTIREFARRLAGLLATNRRIYICGNGGSASAASHFASDLNKLGFDAVSFTDNFSRASAIINDEGWDYLYTSQMGHFGKGDALILFTVHGCEATKTTGGSANLYEAAKLCRERMGDLYVFSGNDGGHLARNFKGQFLTVKSGDCDVVEGIHVVLAHLVLAEIKEMMVK